MWTREMLHILAGICKTKSARQGEDIDGEGIGVTQPVTQDEINYVISFRTESWLELGPSRKLLSP